MFKLVISLVILAGLLAGCVNPDVGPPTSTTQATSESSTSLTVLPTGGPAPGLSRLNSSILSGCTGLFSVVRYPWSLGPASPPPNWTGDSDLGQEVSQLALDCQRVSWGSFERPTRMVWEVHTNAPAPASCAEGSYSRYLIITRIFLEDMELADFLNETYGLPVHSATVWRNETLEQGQRHDVWTWTPLGYQPSWMENWRLNRSDFDTSDTYNDRYAWDNGSGISFMDEHSERKWGANTVLTPGEMNPPMLNAAHGAPYSGVGTLWDDVHTEFTIRKFGDYACTEPLPL